MQPDPVEIDRPEPGVVLLRAKGDLDAYTAPGLRTQLHEATDGWTVPLLALITLSVPLFLLALYVGRPAHLEDQLAARQPDSQSYR